MKVDYSKLFKKMKEEHMTQKEFLNGGFSGATLNRLRNNESITTETICKICDYFCCMPDEILEFIPEPYYEEKKKQKLEKEKQELEAQIAELQAKLKKL